MARPPGVELDELQYYRPEVLQYWQGLHANSVHGYLKESPFLDQTSKNGLLWTQAWEDGRTYELCANRERFEQVLRSRPGLEHMIVGEPQPTSDPAQGPDTGIWVIRKQDRQKRPPREDELTVLGTHYAVGDHMYQAPSVYDVLSNRLVFAMTSLSKFVDEASALPIYNPAAGYTYHPPAPSMSSTHAAQSSASIDGSVAPASQPDGQESVARSGTRASSIMGTSAQSGAQTFDPTESRALEHSFRLMLEHGDEYMDENLLRGEPGNFVFTHTKDRLRAKQAETEAAAAKQREKDLEKAKATPAAFSSRTKEESPTVDAKPQPVRKSSKAEGKKRRKSRVAVSPVSPTTSSPAPGGSSMVS